MTNHSFKNPPQTSDRQARFESIMGGRDCPRPIYDQILTETEQYVLVPTLGSILPNWLLLIPKVKAANFEKWQGANATNPYALVSEALANCPHESAIWFEHGASFVGSELGCGVDHAHIHLLLDAPFSFDSFVRSVRAASALNWSEVGAALAYEGLCQGKSYFIAGSAGRSIFAQEVELAGSQFFRRVIASMIGKPDSWNYRTHPHLENVEATIRTFRKACA